MDNFLNFIAEDIEAKKILLSTMPINNKTNIKKFDAKIDAITEKYDEYKSRVKKYIDAKSKSFNIKDTKTKSDTLRNKVMDLEHVRFVLNPFNTYFEKMGFDNFIFELDNYYDFNFNCINEIINKFLGQFDLAGIKLTADDFNYNCYVNEYMTAFLDVRGKKSNNYDEVSRIFEKIYWTVPDIIFHIESNFRKLIRENEKKFINYIDEIKKKIMLENEISSYEQCLDKLKVVYTELSEIDGENINDIINLAKSHTIDINTYFEDSKVRTTTYDSMVLEPINVDDKQTMDKFYKTLNKLKTNIEEYISYIKFIPLIDDFKKEYEKQITSDVRGYKSGVTNKNLKNIKTQILAKEAKLNKVNQKIISDKPLYVWLRKDKNIKQLKVNSIKYSKELYDLYKIYDKEYFKDKVLSILTSLLSMAELLHLYYSFDYFKKIAIKKVFRIDSYDEIVKYSEDFDLFAMNPTNIILSSVNVFEKNNINRVIMNKYRLDNININEDSLDPDELEVLLDKVKMLLRINEVENSQTTIEKIWFMVQAEKISLKEQKKNT